MAYTHTHIVEAYASLFEGRSATSKIERNDRLSKSQKTVTKIKEDDFFKTFGAFASTKSPGEIISAIRSYRKFRKKEIKC